MSDPVSASIPIEHLGPPGIPGELFVVPDFKDGSTSDSERLSDGSRRNFRLAALLGKQSSGEGAITAVLLKEDGDSFVVAPDSAVVHKLYSPVGEILIYHNSRRELSLIEFSCLATSIADAKLIFLRAITPFLDRLSFSANIPIHVTRVVCNDTKHGIQSMGYVAPHPSMILRPHALTNAQELLPIYALYREAKNNASFFYKFLCYYKILEGIYGWLRPALFKMAKSKNLPIATRRELVPTLHDPSPEQAALQGKPIKLVFDTRFRQAFRDQVAHFLLNDGRPLNVSDSQIASQYSRELVLIEPCVKVVVQTHEAYLEVLHTTGKAIGES